VEAVFIEHPSVAEAALIGIPDDKWGEVGLMAVVLEKGLHGSEEELKDYSQERLARYKVPKVVRFVDSLPHSPYGKVMKSELKKQILD
jgi:acyl-CoA synthetase (AMP-forming)/AMP-acid ligase II